MSLGDWKWTTRVADLSAYIDPAATDIQVRFRVADLGPLGLGCADAGSLCPGPGPFLDQVRIGRRVPAGPVIEPGDAKAWNNLGVCLWQLRRFDEAKHCLQRALQIDPQDPDAAANLQGLA